MKRVVVMLGIIALCVMAFSSLLMPGREPARAQAKDKDKDTAKGKIVKTYRKGQGEKPAWVSNALGRSIGHLKRQGEAFGLSNAQAELSLLDANEDDLGLTHLRLDQVFNGVPVFGGQLVTHSDASTVRNVNGRVFKEARGVNTKPKITADEAIAAAKAALGHGGDFAKAPEAQLVILPHQVINPENKPGATLTYKVELLINDGTPATARHQYFVDARDGKIVWHFNAMDTGVGYSLYSGTVWIDTFQIQWGRFRLTAFNRSYMSAIDAGTWTIFEDPDDYWGNFSTSSRQTAGVDAHFGQIKTWDYYYNVLGRFGVDNNGYRMYSYVHYGGAYNNAFWDGNACYFGDGDGYTFSPLVSVDVVAHEATHAVTQFSANLTYSGESGGSNESFSDIFGTAVEHYTGINPDFNVGEDCFTPYSPGDALRYMSNPRADGASIDHYSQYYNGIDVHYSSGIQNNAFYLLSQGGTNSTSGISVSGVGLDAAQRIFYRALALYLWPSAGFANVRNATLSAAADLYGTGSAQYNSTAQAWCAVGVGSCPGGPGPGYNGAIFVSQSVPTSMTAGQTYSVSVTMYNSGTTTWTSDVYKLGAQNPHDNVTWGTHRIYLPYGTTVSPGSYYTFYFNVTAPSTPGYYNFQWRMVQEGVEWFGDYTANVVVNVTGSGGTGCDPAAEQACYSRGPDWEWSPFSCRCTYIGGSCFDAKTMRPLPCVSGK
ncbi:MAG TPA: M4 family metallopeptidase [Pyrinomonadaceae bacterium]|nr:M4 family metallopeptidase [Pyrinomonadaceae bacterium]